MSEEFTVAEKFAKIAETLLRASVLADQMSKTIDGGITWKQMNDIESLMFALKDADLDLQIALFRAGKTIAVE